MSAHAACWANAVIYTPQGSVEQGRLVMHGGKGLDAMAGAYEHYDGNSRFSCLA